MKIEIWSDIVCPFCYLGKKHLELALEQLKELEVSIVHRSFELDPLREDYDGVSTAEELATKYGMTLEVAQAQLARIVLSARDVGLHYDFDSMKGTNTFDAHRLIKYAKSNGKESEMLDRIYKAFFSEGKLVSDHDTLVALAQEVGLDGTDTRNALEDESAYALEVREDEAQAKQYGIDVVPFFVINDRYAFSGASPVQDIVDTLKKIIEDGEA